MRQSPLAQALLLVGVATLAALVAWALETP